MPKEDNLVDPGVDVQVISVPAGVPGGQISIPSPSGAGNGVVVMPLPQVGAMQGAQGPAVILITVGGKKEEKSEKKSSSVFQRL